MSEIRQVRARIAQLNSKICCLQQEIQDAGGGSGTVTEVSSANGDATVDTGTSTPVITIVSAPKLSTARLINGTSFDGTANITVTAAAGTLTGTTLNATIVGSSLTSLGTIGTGVWQGTAIGDTYISSASTWNAKEAALTFSTGLTRTTNTITNNLSTGVSGGQTIIGGTASGNNITYSSTSNATKGFHYWGSSTKMAFDETNGRLGIGVAAPATFLQVLGTTEQLRLAYDASNYFNVVVASTGATTINVTGSSNQLTYSGQCNFVSVFASANLATQTNPGTRANFFAVGGSLIGNSASQTEGLFAGASNVQYRSCYIGTTASVLSANTSYTNVLIASSPVTEATSGTHALLANLVVNPLGTVTGGTATTTNTATVYVNGAGSAPGATNYGLWISGAATLNRIDGITGHGTAPVATSYVTFGASTTTVSSFNIPVGTAPTSPVDGDVWREDNTNTGLKVRINGVTKTITVS